MFSYYLVPLVTIDNNVAMLNLNTKCICDRQMATNVFTNEDKIHHVLCSIFDTNDDKMSNWISKLQPYIISQTLNELQFQ